MCELSIIVPVYKAEKYIERTVKALLTQCNVDYEILLIDDGSPDRSGELCDELSKNNDRIRCFHIPNGGPSHARNLGISQAKGKYIAFCDSDDMPSENMYGLLVDILKEKQVQLVLCDIFTERDNRNFGFPWDGNQCFRGQECQEMLLASMLGNLTDDDTNQPVWGSSVRSIYLKEVIEKYRIQFPEDIRFAEDLVFNVEYISHCTSCYIWDKVLYRYMLNEDSLMNSFVKYNPNMFMERLSLINNIESIIKSEGYNDTFITRFETSQRCYIHECIGNAARSIPTHGYFHAYREIRHITSDVHVCKLFSKYMVRIPRKAVIYRLIKLKLNLVLLLYYAIRLK